MTKKNYALVALSLFIMEVIIATKLNDYHFIRAYFGDFLVVILLYCMVKAVYDFGAKRLAIGIFAFSVIEEVAQYFRIADVLQLRGWARVNHHRFRIMGDKRLMYGNHADSALYGCFDGGW